MGWTEDRVESLKKLWLDGLSASQIAKQLGGDLTRNAVIGKVHRLGLSGRAAASQPQRQVFKPARPARPAVSAAPLSRRPEAVAARPDPTPLAPIEECGSATVLTLGAHMCKWPIGDPSSAGFAFCGRGCSPAGGPYCAHHAQLAYQPPAKKAGARTQGADLARSLRRYI